MKRAERLFGVHAYIQYTSKQNVLCSRDVSFIALHVVERGARTPALFESFGASKNPSSKWDVSYKAYSNIYSRNDTRF